MSSWERQITGFTGLSKTGVGTLTLATTNTYAVPQPLRGTLSVECLAQFPVARAGNVLVNGTLDLGLPTLSTVFLFGWWTTSARRIAGADGEQQFQTLFSGIIQNTSGTLELNESGSGTLTWWNNTYSGVTVINSGALQIATVAPPARSDGRSWIWDAGLQPLGHQRWQQHSGSAVPARHWHGDWERDLHGRRGDAASWVSKM